MLAGIKFCFMKIKLSLREWIGVTVIVFLAVMLLLEKCNAKKCPEIKETDRKDSIVYVKGDSVYFPVPAPYRVTDNGIFIYNPEPLESVNGNATDYIGPVLCPEQQIKIYPDTLKFDSLGTIVLRDSIQGKILKRTLKYNLQKYFTTVTNTAYDTVYVDRNRVKLLIGVNFTGNKNRFISYYGANIGLQFRNGNLLQAGVGYMNKELFYSAGFSFKIGIHK